MCLYLKRKRILPQIALTPKTVYKIVHANKNKTAFTPLIFDNKEWFYKLGVKARSKLTCTSIQVTEGLHSFAALSEALYVKTRLGVHNRDNYYTDCVVLECKIPRFSKYYTNKKDFASNKLIPIKVIE